MEIWLDGRRFTDPALYGEALRMKAAAMEDRTPAPANQCKHCGEHRNRHVGRAMSCFGGLGTVWTPGE